MEKDIRRDLINRMFDKEMNKDFNSYRSANKALDSYHSMYPSNLSVNDSYSLLLHDQIVKDLGYKNATIDEAINDYHSWYGRGSTISHGYDNPNSLGSYNVRDDAININKLGEDNTKLSTLAHEIGHETDWKHGPASMVTTPHKEMGYYTDGVPFSSWLDKTGKIMPREVNGVKLDKRDLDGKWSADWAERLRKEDKKLFGSSFEMDDMLSKAGVTGSDVAEGFSYGHHLPDNKHIESSTGIILPKEAAIHPIEKRLIIARMMKNMGLRSLPIIGSASEMASNMAGLIEAAKHPLVDPDEIGLRMVNAIAPNEQTEADVEYMKKLREYNSL